jgi:hypothetical protein
MPLLETLNELIARDLGVQPEDVTSEFIHEMRKRMEKDPLFQIDRSSEFFSDPALRQLTFEEELLWRAKCRAWACEVLAQGVTSCS